MRYYKARFKHDDGVSVHFFAIDREIKREATEKYLMQSQGYQSVVVEQLHEFASRADYEEAERIAIEKGGL